MSQNEAISQYSNFDLSLTLLRDPGARGSLRVVVVTSNIEELIS